MVTYPKGNEHRSNHANPTIYKHRTTNKTNSQMLGCSVGLEQFMFHESHRFHWSVKKVGKGRMFIHNVQNTYDTI